MTLHAKRGIFTFLISFERSSVVLANRSVIFVTNLKLYESSKENVVKHMYFR